MASKNKTLGQYFTPEFVADYMAGLSTASIKASVLEPAAGKGVFLRSLEKRGFKNLLGYEIDKTLALEAKAPVIYKSFVSAEIKEKFDLIIGNPPYIRWKNLDDRLKKELDKNKLWNNHFNSLCDYLYLFILKSVELLKDNGELIFITPEYWINTNHSKGLRSYLTANGYFTNIIHFNETPIFDKVASSIIIFRYIKSKELKTQQPDIKIVKHDSSKRLSKETLERIAKCIPDKKTEFFSRKQFKPGEQWILAPGEVTARLEKFEKKCVNNLSFSFDDQGRQYITLGDIAQIGNGLVSGLDRAFQIPASVSLSSQEVEATIPVLKAKNIDRYFHGEITSYIYLNGGVQSEDDLMHRYPAFYELLGSYRDELDQRYNYNKKINYWEWAFPRSYSLFRQDRERIFVPCKERISHKDYFRFTYVPSGIFPTQDVTAIFLKPGLRESIYYILALLNSENVFDWLRFKGVVKGNIVEFSEKPLASVPVRLIDWNNDQEVKTHDEISALCKNYIDTKNTYSLDSINEKLGELFQIF